MKNLKRRKAFTYRRRWTRSFRRYPAWTQWGELACWGCCWLWDIGNKKRRGWPV